MQLTALIRFAFWDHALAFGLTQLRPSCVPTNAGVLLRRGRSGVSKFKATGIRPPPRGAVLAARAYLEQFLFILGPLPLQWIRQRRRHATANSTYLSRLIKQVS